MGHWKRDLTDPLGHTHVRSEEYRGAYRSAALCKRRPEPFALRPWSDLCPSHWTRTPENLPPKAGSRCWWRAGKEKLYITHRRMELFSNFKTRRAVKWTPYHGKTKECASSGALATPWAIGIIQKTNVPVFVCYPVSRQLSTSISIVLSFWKIDHFHGEFSPQN